jgi:hypothetical protein
MEVQDFMVLSASGNRPVDLDVDAWCLKVLQLSPAIDLCSFFPPSRSGKCQFSVVSKFSMDEAKREFGTCLLPGILVENH